MLGPTKKPSRLGSWDGLRNATQTQASLLSGLCRRPVLARLGIVFAATVLMAGLSYLWGLPVPYRIGERWAHDVQARVSFEVIDPDVTDRDREAAIQRLPLEKRTDPAECARAIRAVSVQPFDKGDVIVPAHQQITEAQRNQMREETRAYERSLPLGDQTRRALALLLIMTLLAVIIVLYVVRYQPKLAGSTQQVAKVCLLIASAHLCWLILARPPWHAGLVPLTVAAIILAVAYRPPLALLMCFSYSLAITASRGNGIDHLLVQIGGQAAAVLLVRNIRRRTQLIEIGAVAGLGYLAMTLAVSLLTHQTWALTISDAVRRFLWGLLGGFLVTGCLPLLERWFGIVTDIRLLELGDGSHLLLQELIRRAPGTYNHSMSVANLAEQASEAIGANGLLTRVGAYFHDIGKMLKPTYFVENQNGENLHDGLEPGLSTLIIIGHVKDGVALAQQYRLPQPVIAFIQQHHGTTLVEYFYRAALRIQEEVGAPTSLADGGPCPLESSFRYPGPKPQTREIGIVMLADAVESASRALSDPAPSSLRKLVRDLLMKRLLDGQFDDSGLTLTELHVIEESMCKGLIALYHSRIKYPGPRDKRVA